MSQMRAIKLQIIPGVQDIEEITSEIAELGADSNIISLSLTRSLGCKVTRKCNQMELIDKTHFKHKFTFSGQIMLFFIVSLLSLFSSQTHPKYLYWMYI